MFKICCHYLTGYWWTTCIRVFLVHSNTKSKQCSPTASQRLIYLFFSDEPIKSKKFSDQLNLKNLEQLFFLGLTIFSDQPIKCDWWRASGKYSFPNAWIFGEPLNQLFHVPLKLLLTKGLYVDFWKWKWKQIAIATSSTDLLKTDP